MLDFNGVSIKSVEDLQEALRIKTNAKNLKYDLISLVDRWGLDNAIQMLSVALAGDGEDVAPLIKFTHEHVPTGHSNDPWESYDTVLIKENK